MHFIVNYIYTAYISLAGTMFGGNPLLGCWSIVRYFFNPARTICYLCGRFPPGKYFPSGNLLPMIGIDRTFISRQCSLVERSLTITNDAFFKFSCPFFLSNSTVCMYRYNFDCSSLLTSRKFLKIKFSSNFQFKYKI